jgi:hypothetical protein
MEVVSIFEPGRRDDERTTYRRTATFADMSSAMRGR